MFAISEIFSQSPLDNHKKMISPDNTKSDEQSDKFEVIKNSKLFGKNENDCQNGLKLLFKSSDNSQVCVKPSSVEKLISRNWANR